MKTLREVGNIDPVLYDTHTQHPLQSYEWGEARKKLGTQVIRIGEYEAETLIHVYQITLHPVFAGYTLGYLPRSEMPSKECLDFLIEYGKKNRIIFFKLEPYVEKKELNLDERLKKSDYPLFPLWTQIVNLNVSEEELLSKIKPKTRYNIRLAEKKGVVIKEMTNDEGFKIFSQLYFDTCKRQGYRGHNLEYHKTIFESLKDISHILIAFHEGTPLAAYELFLYKERLYYPYGGSSLEKRNLMGTNLLMWEAIKFGKKNGAHTFDMWGSAPPDYEEDHPFAGFTRLKEGYGSTFVEFVGTYDLVVHPSLYSLFNLANKARQILLKLK